MTFPGSNSTHPPHLTGANALPVGPSRTRGDEGMERIERGFEVMMEKLQKMESRIDHLSRRDEGRENDSEVYIDPDRRESEYGDPARRVFENDDRFPPSGSRNRWGLERENRRDNFHVGGYSMDGYHGGYHGGYRGRGGRQPPRRGGTAVHNRHLVEHNRRNRRATAWDPPVRNLEEEDDEGPWGGRYDNAWEPPYRRGGHNRPTAEPPKGIQMRPPPFDGSDAPNWISRVQYYFDHARIPEDERLHYVVMLFEPPASEWIFNYRANNPSATWPEFLEDVRQRFDPQSFRNYTGLISKLVQTGTVAEYHETFERYLNRVDDLSETSLIPIFIAGLKEPIREKVELQQPLSLAATMALALRLAATQAERQHQTSQFARRLWPSRDGTQQLTGEGSTHARPTATSRPNTEPPKFQPIRVSSAERSERSRKGLCWHCPEKWSVDHVCKAKMLCYIGEDEDEGVDLDDPEEGNADEVITANLTHLHTMDGHPRSRPFHVEGTIGGADVRVLIDTGATMDFLHPKVATALQLVLEPIRPFRVLVGNGASLACTHMSRQTKLCMQGTTFPVDLHILEHHGSDVVLGMDWLKSLGKILADFGSKTLEFDQDGRRTLLRGVAQGPKEISRHHLALMAALSSDHERYEVARVEADNNLVSERAEKNFPLGIPDVVLGVLEELVAGEGDPAGVPRPETFRDDRPISLPMQVLGTKILWCDGRPTPHVLVRGSDGLASTTWESAAPLKEKYPTLFLEDKEDANGEGVDKNTEDATEDTDPTPSAEAGPNSDADSETPDVAYAGDGSLPDVPDDACTGDTSVADGERLVPRRELRPRKHTRHGRAARGCGECVYGADTRAAAKEAEELY